LKQRDADFGLTRTDRARRRATLQRLFELFEDHDPTEEIRRLKTEDAGF
jgi:hypothetical protein